MHSSPLRLSLGSLLRCCAATSYFEHLCQEYFCTAKQRIHCRSV